jgi:hypothetical protein
MRVYAASAFRGNAVKCIEAILDAFDRRLLRLLRSGGGWLYVGGAETKPQAFVSSIFSFVSAFLSALRLRRAKLAATVQ